MSHKGWTLLAAVLGSGIVFLDSTVVNVALPKMGQELGSPWLGLGVLEAQSYVYSAYLLALSSLLILAGALNDFFGRRRVFAIGLSAFGFASVACGLAPNMELLILFRVVQGVAGALLVPSSLSLITAAYEGPERARAIGIWAAASAATTTLGQPLGGLVVDTISWRAAFLINVPIVILAVWATVSHVRETRDEKATGHFDWRGAVVVFLAVGGLAFGTIRGQQSEWHDSSAFVILAIGVIATVVFPFLMARARDPLVPLDLFRSRNFSVTNLSTFVIYGALYVAGQYQALFVQGTLGYTALAAGLMGLPTGIALALFSTRVGSLAGRYGPRPFMVIGPAFMAAGLAWLARVPATSEPWRATPSDLASLVPTTSYLVDFLPGVLGFAVGLTIMVAPLTTALMASIPVNRSGLGSAINNAISRVGPQLAGALIFVAITASFYTGLQSRVPTLDTSSATVRAEVAPLNRPKIGDPVVVRAAQEASTDAFHLAMLAAALLCGLGAVVNAVGIRNQRQPSEPVAEGPDTSREPEPAGA